MDTAGCKLETRSIFCGKSYSTDRTYSPDSTLTQRQHSVIVHRHRARSAARRGAVWSQDLSRLSAKHVPRAFCRVQHSYWLGIKRKIWPRLLAVATSASRGEKSLERRPLDRGESRPLGIVGWHLMARCFSRWISLSRFFRSIRG